MQAVRVLLEKGLHRLRSEPRRQHILQNLNAGLQREVGTQLNQRWIVKVNCLAQIWESAGKTSNTSADAVKSWNFMVECPRRRSLRSSRNPWSSESPNNCTSSSKG